jgi:hypothetical protein
MIETPRIDMNIDLLIHGLLTFIDRDQFQSCSFSVQSF